MLFLGKSLRENPWESEREKIKERTLKDKERKERQGWEREEAEQGEEEKQGTLRNPSLSKVSEP